MLVLVRKNVMQSRICACLVVTLMFSLNLPALAAQADPNSPKTAQSRAQPHDGQHDFDFEAGSWKIHLKKLLHPLSGSQEWVEFDGTTFTQPVWDGRAWIEQFETNGAIGHIEGLTLRLYNPQSHQWRLYWATSKSGILEQPAIGGFKDGRGEFIDQEPFNGRAILVRMVWSQITPNSAHSEQSFSDDGGKTWEVNWITDQTRVSDQAEKLPTASDATPRTAAAAQHDGQHDFDPLIGNWKFHLKRIDYRSGSHEWVQWEGTDACQKLWDGRANLDTVELNAPTGHIEGLTLRLYNPQSHQWRLYWANSKVGVLDPPQIGEFKNGLGEFYAQDTINGKTILIRFQWTRLDSASPHFEQAFSDDGGKTWEVNWITNQTKVTNESAKAH